MKNLSPALILAIGIILTPAAFANSGLDTTPGVTTMPFSINDVQTMTLTATGLGIGTANPWGKLQLDGAGAWTNLTLTNSANWSTIAWRGNNGISSLITHYGGDSTNEFRFGRYSSDFSTWQANPVRFTISAPDSSIYLDGSGNLSLYNGSLGIGLAPTQKLDVNGSFYIRGGTEFMNDASGHNSA